MIVNGIIQFQASDNPVLSPIAGRDGYWRLIRDYDVVQYGEGLWTAPRGMITDGASIPRLFWRVIGHPFETDLIYWAILHDAAYKGRLLHDGLPAGLDREQSDKLAFALMTGIRVGADIVSTPAWKRPLMFDTLRMFGGPNFQPNPTAVIK